MHSLRNIFSAIQFGHRALQDNRADEQAFKAMHDMVGEKLKELKGLIVQASHLLAANRDLTSPAAEIRVLCVDDSTDTTSVMRMVIDASPKMECVGCLASADHLVEEARRLTQPPNAPTLVVLLDVVMPGKSPFDATCELTAEFPQIKTLIFSGHDNSAFIGQAKNAGARGCISKTNHPDVIVRALRDVAGGSTWWPAAASSR